MKMGWAHLGLAILTAFAAVEPASAATSIVWRVSNPFRFYRDEAAFAPHRAAYEAIVAANGGTRPADIVRQIERKLNDPRSDVPLAQWRLGWAAKSVGSDKHCYGEYGEYGRSVYLGQCQRKTGAGARMESYINPQQHAVFAGLDAATKARLAGKTCNWRWQSPPAAAITRAVPCGEDILIDNVPYPAGVSLAVTTPEGPVAAVQVKVTDLLVVGLGDSFASGEGNPDRPVELSATRALLYAGEQGGLPLRVTNPQIFGPDLGEYDATTLDRFRKGHALWVSRDCHRSQYSYQFRVALQLAVENPHRAVTLVHLACTGAEATAGLFGSKTAREPDNKHLGNVQAQLDQLLDLVCVQRAYSKTVAFTMQAPVKGGNPALIEKTFSLARCAGNKRKREIDLVLLSVGGNDIGFAALVGYTILESTASIAKIVPVIERMTGERMLHEPIAAYLPLIDRRLMETRRALIDLFGVPADRVVHTSYERMPADEADELCAGNAGLDVHRSFRFIADRLAAVDSFSRTFFNRLKCTATPGPGCPGDMAVGSGTGFHFIDAHQAAFKQRGICAVTAAEKQAFAVPRQNTAGEFKPSDPSQYTPYVHRTRLFVSPNDAFLTANSYDEKNIVLPGDAVQHAFAALYSGAFHRTAEAHAIVADAVLETIRAKGLAKP